MTAGPASPLSGLTRPPVRHVVLVGDATGAFPTSTSDIVPWLLPLSVDVVTGGATFNQITMQVDLATLGVRYQDVPSPLGSNRIVEVRQVLDSSLSHLIAWGKLATNTIQLDERQESDVFSARIDWYLLGPKVLETVPYWDPVGLAAVDVVGDLKFNPSKDDNAFYGNRSDQTDADGAYYFSDPTGTGAFDRWSIATAVHRLCWLMNPDETYLTNPTLADLQATFTDATIDAMLVDVEIKAGATLNEALDTLLHPLGYSWMVTASGEIGSVVTELRFFKFGDGVQRSLKIQRIGDDIDGAKTNVEALQLEYDVSSHPNEFLGVGERERVEITVELIPGWEDSEDIGLWASNETDPDYKNDGAKRHVGRRWIVNEAGQHNGLRPALSAAQTFTGLGTILPKQRKFLPCITSNADGSAVGHNGYHLIWFGFGDVEIEAEFEFGVLENELGIWITDVPYMLWLNFIANPTTYRLKLTATIELDSAVNYRATRRAESVNGAAVPIRLDLSDRFKQRRVQQTGTWKSRFYDDHHETLASVVAGAAGSAQLIAAADVSDKVKAGQRVAILGDTTFSGVFTVKSVSTTTITVEEEIATGGTGDGTLAMNTDSMDSTLDIEAFVTQVQADQDYAVVRLSGGLFGVDHSQYERGDLIVDAQPRNVSFNAVASGVRAPQILGITYQYHPEQVTTLHLEQVQHDNQN